MGRLPGARLPRRRRRSTRSRATSSRSIATSRSWPIRSARRCPSAASSTARSSSPATTGSTSRRCCCGSTPPRRGSRCSPPSHPRRFVAWDLLALGDEDLRAVPQGERRARLEAVLGGVEAPIHLTPATRDRATAGGLVRAVRGRRARWRRRQAARCAVPARQAGDAQDQAPADGRLRRRRVPLAQERPRHPYRLAAARAVRRRRHAQPRGHHLVVHLGPPRRADRGAGSAARERARGPPLARVGRVGRRWATPTPPASDCRARPRAGTAARTCRGSRCDRSASPRSRTTTSRASRFRHGTTFKRWRPDKPPEACRYDQLEETVPYLLDEHLRQRGLSDGPARARRRWLDQPATTSRRSSGSAGPSSSGSSRGTTHDRRRGRRRAGAARAYDDVDAMLGQANARRRLRGRAAAPGRGDRRAPGRGPAIPFLTEKPLAAADADGPGPAGGGDRRGRPRRRRRLPPAGARHHGRGPRRLGGPPPAQLVVARWLDATPGPAWWGRADEGGGQVIEQATHLYDLAR